jgi:acetylornithine deacetylase/succinyl-diaminopimelate desuccinylase-like protein
MRTARRLLPALVAAALALVAVPCHLDGSVLDVVNQVSQTSYTDYLEDWLYAWAGDNRGYGVDHDPARDNIAAAFLAFGLTPIVASPTPYLDPFTYNSTTYYNVVGMLPGAVHPDQYFVVGAHYDSVNNPGADDDASGVAGVLEAARVLSQYQFEYSLVFIAFDREEQGLFGSSAWAAEHSTDDILGMVSLDMIAYNATATPDQMAIYTVSGNPNVVTQGLVDSFALYGNGVTASFLGMMGYSDHVGFSAQGFPSALLIERGVWGNPYYHTQQDSLTTGYLDYEYATNVTRAAVGFLATDGGLVPEPAAALLVLSALALLAALRARSRRTPRSLC